MSSRYRTRIAFALTLLTGAAGARELRVCADPDNLPFSNAAGEGFENRIAVLLARDLDTTLVLVPAPQRGPRYIRATLGAGRCDAIMGLPAATGRAAMTQPYYRSGWVFVWRQGVGKPPRSFDDPALAASAAIGVPVVEKGGGDTAPALALVRHGLAGQLRRYRLDGSQGEESTQARMISDLAAGKLDLAIAWGPFAGWLAAQQPVPLAMAPTPADDGPDLPLTVSIAIGVRRGDLALRDALNTALRREREAVAAILAEYRVPLAAE
jgi:mxaJ protein